MRRLLPLCPLLALACSGDDHDLVVRGERFDLVDGAVTIVAVLDPEVADVEVRQFDHVDHGTFRFALPEVVPDGESRVVQLWVDDDDDGLCTDDEAHQFDVVGDGDTRLVVRPGDGEPGACAVITTDPVNTDDFL